MPESPAALLPAAPATGPPGCATAGSPEGDPAVQCFLPDYWMRTVRTLYDSEPTRSRTK